MHQVETSFLLRPLSPPGDDGKDRVKPKANSSSDDKTKSDEDFGFIKDNDTLDPQTEKLLKGIIQAPLAEKKRFDKEDNFLHVIEKDIELN